MVTITLDKSIPGFHNEAGGHRIQRVPPNEKRGRVHTSTVTCAVIEGARRSKTYPDSDFSVRYYSGTGKGGQRRNKVMSCVTMTHIPTGLSQNSNGRSRIDNEEEAKRLLLDRLREMDLDNVSGNQNKKRNAQIGSGMRGDKRRTYRFQDDSIVDHITGQTTSCKLFMRGGIERLW